MIDYRYFFTEKPIFIEYEKAQQAGSRSSTPQTKSEHGLPSKEGASYPSNALGPDFNHENERLQTLVQGITGIRYNRST